MLWRLIFFLLLLITLISCSFNFQSRQLSFVKTLLERDNDEIRPNWLLSSELSQRRLYAVNYKNEVWFVGENDLIIQFDGWNITVIDGLVDSRVIIKKQSNDLVVTQSSTIVAYYYCEPWELDYSDDLGAKIFVQNCQESDQVKIKNEIRVNSLGELVRLDFNFHPSFQNLRLERIESN